MRDSTKLAMLFVLVLLTGCAVGPQYTPPQVTMPQQWLQTATSVQTADTVSASGNLRQWWRNFDDPLLDALIEAALSGSPTLKAAQARLQQARALYKGTAGQQYPDVDVVSGITHERRSENALRFSSGSETTLYQAGFDASWELDVFGAVSRQLESAGAKVEAAQMELADAQVTLTAEVARTFIELRTLRQRYRIAHENARHRQEAYELMLARRQAGLVAEFDVAQARAEWASSQATLPDLDRRLHQALHGLELLTGGLPGSWSAQLLSDESEAWGQLLKGLQPVGLPSDLLRRRPDIRRAEHHYASAIAQVGVAEAQMYPRFMLTGSAGLQSLAAEDFFDADSRFYTLGPTVRWPVLQFGRLQARVDQEEATAVEASNFYEATVLRALSEVESALVGYHREFVREKRLQEALDANRESLKLAEDLYHQGLTTYLAVIDAQRQMYLAEDAATQSSGELRVYLVTLYKSLGGGWEGSDLD